MLQFTDLPETGEAEYLGGIPIDETHLHAAPGGSERRGDGLPQLPWRYSPRPLTPRERERNRRMRTLLDGAVDFVAHFFERL